MSTKPIKLSISEIKIGDKLTKVQFQHGHKWFDVSDIPTEVTVKRRVYVNEDVLRIYTDNPGIDFEDYINCSKRYQYQFLVIRE